MKKSIIIQFFAFLLIVLIIPTNSAKPVSRVMIMITGQIIDEDTKKPIPGTIVFETVPYGNHLGVISSIPDEEGFKFWVHRNGKIRIKAKAGGYLTSEYMVKDLSKITEDEFRININLIPLKKDQLINLRNVIFDQGKFLLRKESYDQLNWLIEILTENPDLVIRLEGHTDYRGSAQNNMELSRRRIESCKEFMVRNGVDASRIQTQAFGGSRPIVKDVSEKESWVNRRVEVRIVNL